MPLAAMFILFESIVHDPIHIESKDNLLFLDTATGYWGRLEYESGGSLQGSILSEFALLARELVHREQKISRSVASGTVEVGTNDIPLQHIHVDANRVSCGAPSCI